ncbi:hypothetical protein GQ457_02G025250 [Hibiscus cannabinus]
MENPSSLSDGHAMHTGHNGRPPDLVLQVSSSPVLERPGSPLEDGRGTKKQRNLADPISVDVVNESMETDEAVNNGATDEAVNNGVTGAAAARPSYARMATKLPQQNSVRRSLNSENEIEVLDEDCSVDESGPFPIIRFSNKVHEQIDVCMKQTLIVRLLGKTVGYKALLNRINALWKPVREIQVIDLENNYYLVKFSDVGDYTRALTDGPWTIYGSYLTVQPWSRTFATSEKHPSKVVVWVRLPGLPFRYYSKALFRRITDVIGTVIKVDYSTRAGERGKFARIAILVDLNKPLRSCIGIDGFVQKLEYEGLNQICFSCGVYGHSMEGCRGLEERTRDVHTSREPAAVDDRTPSFSSKGAELFGPWMVVENRRRRTKTSSVSDNYAGLAARSRNSSRFGVLEEHEEAVEVDVHTDRDAASTLPQGVAIPGIRSAAYMASNPDKSKKKKKGTAESHDRVVLPSIPGQKTMVVNREASSSRGVHKAVSIVEDSVKSKRVVGINMAKSKGGVARMARDKVFASGHNMGSLAGSDLIRGGTEQVDIINEDMVREGRDAHVTTHERSEDPPDTDGIILVDEDCMDASDEDATDEEDGHRIAY